METNRLMLALEYYGRRDIRLERIPVPAPTKNEILLKITDAGISQTQINEFVEGPFIIDKTPLIPCQEFGGIVEAVGPETDPSLLGKQVAVLPRLSCGKCRYCREGRENLCNKLSYHGLLGRDGGFAEYAVIDADHLFPIGNRSLLTFVEPILVSIHAARRLSSNISLGGKRVLILGAGAVGISVAVVWRDLFGADVYITDTLSNRLKRAEKAGLTVVKTEHPTLFPIVVDAAGMDTLYNRPALLDGIKSLEKGGTLINIGTYFHPITLVPSTLLLAELNLLESIVYDEKDVSYLPRAIERITMDFTPFIDPITLERIIEDGYYRSEVDKDGFTRIVVRPCG